MSKQFLLFLNCFVALSLISGCGVKKPLYQTPPKTVEKTKIADDNHNKEQPLDQQEKR